jgi:citrate lyase subunit beta / citryl-CoA lyase
VTALRSLLFVPGTSANRFAKAVASGADAVFFDLEDAVEAGRKAEARRLVGDWLASTPSGPAARLVRVNAPGSAWIDDDLAWLPAVVGHLDGVVLPKIETPADVERVARAAPDLGLMPMIETSRGVLRAVDIVSADANILALVLGAEDLTAELGIPRTVDGEELCLARSQVVLAAATIGADAIDAVFVDLTAPEALRRDARRARALGFRGKTAIHPDQIAVINDVFSPSAEEIARARRVIDADAAARAQGQGAFRLDDRMVDAPIVARAKRILALADSVRK